MDSKYLMFPLSMMRNFFIEPQKTMNDVISFGVAKYAESVDTDILEGLNIIVNSLDADLKIYNRIMKSRPERDPWVMINKGLCFDYRDNVKTEFELAQMAAFVAIRSILGRKSYCKTNKDHIAARMFGYSSHAKVPDLTANLQTIYMRYTDRYKMDQLLSMLEMNWNVKLYSRKGRRGIYITTSNSISMKELVEKAEKTLRQRIIEHKKNKDEIIKQVLCNLNNDESKAGQN